MIAQEDTALLDWLLGIARGRPNASGDFLRSLADAALRADTENYPILRPALLELQKKYPQYSYQGDIQELAGEYQHASAAEAKP